MIKLSILIFTSLLLSSCFLISRPVKYPYSNLVNRSSNTIFISSLDGKEYISIRTNNAERIPISRQLKIKIGNQILHFTLKREYLYGKEIIFDGNKLQYENFLIYPD